MIDTLRTFVTGSGQPGNYFLTRRAQRGRAGAESRAAAGFHPHRAGVRAAELRREEGDGAGCEESRELECDDVRATTKSRSWLRGSCCRTSRACRCSWISRRCAVAVRRMGKDPEMIEPLVPVDLVVDHSVQVDFAGTRRFAGAESGSGIPPQPRTLSVSEMGRAGVRHLQRGAAGHRHRAPGESGIPREGRARSKTMRRFMTFIPTRWSEPIRTRR